MGKKILLGLLIVLTVLILFWFWVSNAHKPSYSGQVALEGMKEDVDVYFDAHGIPHINALSAEDGYRALGYVHAQDRLFQMDLMRRVGLGELSALLGPDQLGVDKFFRTLGTRSHALQSATLAKETANDAEWMHLLQAYLDGVNAYIEKGKKPIEYRLIGEDIRPFVIEDLYGTVAYMSFTFAMALKTEPLLSYMQQQLDSSYFESLSVDPLDSHFPIPVHSPERTTNGQILGDIHSIMNQLPVAPFIGSNSWVVGQDKSASGQVLFCNDTHINFSQPSVWYEAHLSYPGYDFYGNHLAGIPFPLIGHSKSYAYGLTMFENDDFDLYIEMPDMDNDDRVIVADTVEAIFSVVDTIYIKDADPELLTIKSTSRGNIINDVLPEIADITDRPVTAWWVFLKQESKAMEALYRISHAMHIDEFESGVRLIHAPGLNVMYGDTDGNIAWWATGQLFQRPEGMPDKFFIDASTGWEANIEWLPFEQNPMAVNPPSGFIYSANNRPDTTSTNKSIPGYYYPGDRGKTIYEFLDGRNDLTVEDMKVLQLHNKNASHQRNAGTMVDAIMDSNHKHADLLQVLRDWDGNHNLESTAPTIYYKWLYHSLHMKMSDEIGEEWFDRYLKTFLFLRSMEGQIADKSSPWWDDVNTTPVEEQSDILNAALDLTIEELTTQWGNKPEKWQWARAVSLEHEHAFSSKKPLDSWLNVGPLAIEGNRGAVNKLDFTLNGEGIYKVKSGPAMRIIIDFADVDQSESINPTGQSGSVFSPYYKDQAQMYANGQYRPQLMDIEQVKNNKHQHLVISSE